MPLTWREEPVGGRAQAVLALTAGGPTLADHVGDDPVVVAAARADLAAEAGVPADRLLFARQVHGRDVVVARGPWPGRPPAADAVVTDVPGLVLGVLVADCVPVLLADPAASVVAVAHAGRRGMDAGVAGAALEVMASLGARDVQAVLGPSVCPRCYGVPAAMRDDVASRHPVTSSVTWDGAPALDVAAGVLAQLVAAGVGVRQLPGCTVERGDLASVRRCGPASPRSAGLAWMADR